jgi:hypothetical protein
MSTSTTGTGTITLGTAESGYQSFADAGVSDGDVVRYAIEDGDDWEIGSGTYTATGTTLSRTVDESSNSDAALNLTGSAVVFITAAAEDVFQGELFAENPSSPTAPSATGTNAVAIGTSAVASGLNAMAFGEGSTASGDESLALGDSGAVASNAVSIGPNAYAAGVSSTSIGVSSDARSTGSTAIGYNSQAFTGSNATALTNSYASGADSFAAAIANNTSTYGATGANSVAMAEIAKATGADGIAIGYNTLATATRSAAFGSLAYALATRSVSLGQSRASGADSFAAGIGTNNASYGSQHAYSVALGYQAVTTADYQIALGSSTAQVKVSGAYTLPTSDGTNGQVLTTDGSGAVTFADAGGGGGDPDLYRDNAVAATTPTASGANAIAIGDNTTASGEDAVAIGDNIVASGLRSISLGGFSDATGDYSVALGAGAQALGENAVAIKGNANYQRTTAIGMNGGGGKSIAGVSNTNTGGATALGGSYAGASDSFAAAIANNSSSYGATGNNSVAIGQQAKATYTNALALGAYTQATNFYAVAIGYNSDATSGGSVSVGYGNLSSGPYAVAIGRENDATKQSAFAFGSDALGDIYGKQAYASGKFVLTGDAQSGKYVLRCSTTDATATSLTTDGSSLNSTNIPVLPNYSAFSFSGTVICREDSTDGNDYASWEIKGALMRDANSTTTVLGVGIINKLYATSGASAWDISLSANTTQGGLQINATGAASTNIRWVATVHTSEVTNP